MLRVQFLFHLHTQQAEQVGRVSTLFLHFLISFPLPLCVLFSSSRLSTPLLLVAKSWSFFFVSTVSPLFNVTDKAKMSILTGSLFLSWL